MLTYVGIGIVFASLCLIFYLFLHFFKKEIVMSLKNILFFVIQIIIALVLVHIVLKHDRINISIIPFTLIASILTTFHKSRVIFFVYLLIICIVGFFAPNSFEFMIIQIIAGMVTMSSLNNMKKRNQIFNTLFFVLITYIIVYAGFLLMRNASFDEFLSIDFYCYVISSLALILYFPLVYIYEKIFGFISDYTLLEISDSNNPLLKKMAETAPGTFQHSLQVANIVESAVTELKGDYLLARAGALYHDIGKIVIPEYYIENQNGENIHDNFDCEDSAQKIISHVEDGVKVATKYKLPKPIIDFVKMHHGTGVTRFFYVSWLNSHPGMTPNLSNFKYPGPKPQTIETAILMMADSIEAASRSLNEYTTKTIENLVNSIIDYQISDGQFDDVDITLKQINIVRSIFIAKIKNIYHSRIVYPNIKNVE